MRLSFAVLAGGPGNFSIFIEEGALGGFGSTAVVAAASRKRPRFCENSKEREDSHRMHTKFHIRLPFPQRPSAQTREGSVP